MRELLPFVIRAREWESGEMVCICSYCTGVWLWTSLFISPSFTLFICKMVTIILAFINSKLPFCVYIPLLTSWVKSWPMGDLPLASVRLGFHPLFLQAFLPGNPLAGILVKNKHAGILTQPQRIHLKMGTQKRGYLGQHIFYKGSALAKSSAWT